MALGKTEKIISDLQQLQTRARDFNQKTCAIHEEEKSRTQLTRGLRFYGACAVLERDSHFPLTALNLYNGNFL